MVHLGSHIELWPRTGRRRASGAELGSEAVEEGVQAELEGNVVVGADLAGRLFKRVPTPTG